MSIHDHTYYPPVEREPTFYERIAPVLACIVVFATIGVLLAWRG